MPLESIKVATKKTSSFTSPTNKLLRPASGSEKTRQEYITSWLRHIGVEEIESEFQTESGPVDLYLINRRILIEVKGKARLKNGPKAPRSGSRTDESAFQQISRYIEAERKQERLLFEESEQTQLSWIGIVTDGIRWWAWEWLESNINGEPILQWQDTRLTKDNIGRLKNLIARDKVGKDWVPADPSTLFEDMLVELKKLFSRVKNYPATNTQQKLWLEQLRSSGNAPTSDIDDMFVTHTLLILISRIVLDTINRYHHDSNRDSITEGFVGWVVTVDRSHLERLESIIRKYDWTRRSGDVLRTLYGHFIKERHRKVFGEYYTPDWLAEMICLEVIDEAFIAKQIDVFRNGEGANDVSCVLDPTCGSGTFLYSAARRILESKALKKSFMSDEQKTLFVSSMIYGMDIHPVAVEMARANMIRVLPKISKANINIYQGDSLLTQRPDATIFSDGGKNMVLFSPAGLTVVIPREFLKSVQDIDVFVKSAKADGAMPKSLGNKLSRESETLLRIAHKSLRNIIIKEANGVWYWYIRNQAAPILLKDRKVGRIVANPPWVTLQEIQNVARKEEIRQLAHSEKLWVGKEVAPRFDIAGLFVKKCLSLYLSGNRSAWVLPQGAAVSGKNWAGFRASMSGRISEFWDMKRLPFPWTPTCVTMSGRGEGEISRTYVKVKGGKIKDSDRWASVKLKIKKISRKKFVVMPSHWFDKNGDLPVRHGASLQPAPLIRIDRVTGVSGGKTSFRTYATHKSPWSALGSLNGTVPSSFVKDTIISTYVFPFMARYNKTVIPVEGSGWIPGRENDAYWRDACALYEKNRGSGTHTPRTLEDRIDHNGILMKQLSGTRGHKVVYNAVGDVLYAARLRPGVIGGVGVCVVSTASKAEAQFLSGMLNAPCMLGAYLSTRRSDRNFHLHFWAAIPIPRYDRSDADHTRLVGLVQKAETIASRVKIPDSPLKSKNLIRGALAGVLGEIDDVVSRILPDHAERGGA